MDLSSSTLKNRAKIKLQGMYGQSLVVSLIYTCIVSVCSSGSLIASFRSVYSQFEFLPNATDGSAFSENPINVSVSYNPLSSIGTLAMFLLAGPLMVGMAHYFLHLADRNNPQLTDLFGHFKNFVNTFVLYLLTTLYTFLWTLLFIIPGIVAAISYSMAPYIVAEHPEIKASDAIKMSKEMMKGHKGEYFILHLSFIGWFLLCLLTAGIGFIFLAPYVSAAQAEFFNEVSGKNVEKLNRGIDPNGTNPFYGDAPAGGGFTQPEQPQGYNGYAQPEQPQGYNGYAQPQQPQGYNGYAQPQQPQGYNGYAQPQQPQGYNGYTQPQQPQGYNGYAQPDKSSAPPADPYGGPAPSANPYSNTGANPYGGGSAPSVNPYSNTGYPPAGTPDGDR